MCKASKQRYLVITSCNRHQMSSILSCAIPVLKALKAGKALPRKRVQNGSCKRNNFTTEDQRLWTERRKIIVLAFFLFHRWKSTNRAGSIPLFKTFVTERNCTKSETFASRLNITQQVN